MAIEKYSSKEYWDEYWKDETRDSYEFVFSEIIDRYLDWNSIKNYMEIGGAPGNIMAHFSQKHGIHVSTIDYCDPSAFSTSLKRLKKENYEIVNEDFSDLNMDNFQGKYDLVASWGFIEHFSLKLADSLIQKQKKMVSEKGYLIIEIPNIRKFNWLIYRIVDKKLLRIHNLKTMNLSFLRRAIEKDNYFKILYGNYYLTSFLGYSQTNAFFEKHRIIKKVFRGVQRIAKRMKVDNIPNPWFSPYIIFIAQRIGDEKQGVIR